jgi:hypothetical protein
MLKIAPTERSSVGTRSPPNATRRGTLSLLDDTTANHAGLSLRGSEKPTHSLGELFFS